MATPVSSSSSNIPSSTDPSDLNENTPEDVTETHLSKLRAFIDDLNVSSKYIVTPAIEHDNVFALIAHWPDAISDRKHIKVQAKLLWDLFKDEYGFDVGEKPFEIPEKNSHNVFARALLDACLYKETGRNLLILYYGGHAENRNDKAVWRSSTSGNGDSIVRWHDLQSIVEDAECDVVMLFDCCYGGAMIERDFGRSFKRRCELLCASAKGKKASGEEKYSFTEALVGALRRERINHQGCTITRLHKLLNSSATRQQYDLKVEPDYQPLSSTPQPSTRLTAFRSATNMVSCNQGMANCTSFYNTMRPLIGKPTQSPPR
jgi:hypothetical protein